jgi:predicted nuclease of predicted toxin-antitoxin system
MWLLDVNIDIKLVEVLANQGIKARSTIELGWRHLINGDLVRAAKENGYTTIMTRDGLFGESAARVLKAYPEIAVVIVTLPQRRREPYIAAFIDAWTKNPIKPLTGKIIS